MRSFYRRTRLIVNDKVGLSAGLVVPILSRQRGRSELRNLAMPVMACQSDVRAGKNFLLITFLPVFLM